MNKNSIDNIIYFISIALIAFLLCLMVTIGIGVVIYEIQMGI